MNKYNKKNFRTKIILIQCLYAYYIHGNINFNELKFIFIKNNINKIFYSKLYFFFNNVSEKHLIIDKIINNHIGPLSAVSLIAQIILKITVFELYFCNNFSVNQVNAHALILLKKFCGYYDYLFIKKGVYDVMKHYKYFSLLM